MSKKLTNITSKLRNQVEQRADRERQEKMAQIQQIQKQKRESAGKKPKSNND